MAKIGLNNFRYAVGTFENGNISYGTVKQPAKAISFTFEPTVADASLYADDARVEYDSRVTGGTVTMGIDREDLTTLADLLGHTTEKEEMIDNINDIAPYVGFGRVTRLMEDGVQKFRATVLKNVKFSEPTESDQTMGESIEFNTSEITGQLIIPADGQWRYRKTFDTQAEAIAYINSCLNNAS